MTSTTDTYQGLSIAHSARRSESPRLRRNLNQGWSFHRDDNTSTNAHLDHLSLRIESWEQVDVPHTVRLEPMNASGGRNFQGICWYARTIPYAPEWQDRIIYLHFEGAMQVCDVWLNGKNIQTYLGGIPFVLDVTSHLKPDRDNQLLLRLDNKDQPDVPPGKPQAELDFVYFGGLYRNVWQSLSRIGAAPRGRH